MPGIEMKIRSQNLLSTTSDFFQIGKLPTVKSVRDERQDYIRMTDSASQFGKILYQTIECYRIE